jgi:hypothetical protein
MGAPREALAAAERFAFSCQTRLERRADQNRLAPRQWAHGRAFDPAFDLAFGPGLHEGCLQWERRCN